MVYRRSRASLEEFGYEQVAALFERKGNLVSALRARQFAGRCRGEWVG